MVRPVLMAFYIVLFSYQLADIEVLLLGRLVFLAVKDVVNYRHHQQG